VLLPAPSPPSRVTNSPRVLTALGYTRCVASSKQEAVSD
jgi:hypothetical protein